MDYRNILDQIEKPDDDFLKQFIDTANPMAQSSPQDIAAQIYLARVIIDTSSKLERAIDKMVVANEKALLNHANALIDSTKATERQTKSLTRATWFIGLFTLALFVIGLIQLFQT